MMTAAQAALLKEQSRYAATKMVNSAPSKDRLISEVSMQIEIQQKMYKMLEEILYNGDLPSVVDSRIVNLLSEARGEKCSAT